jgi:hypothetical protein
MNVVQPPPMQPGDDLDGLLRKFFRRQLPNPWPPPRLLSDVSSCQRRPANGQNLMRSRWTLAASVALLLFGSWLLPNRFTTDARTGPGPNGPMITNIPLDAPKAHRKQQEIENKNKPGLAADEGEPIPELDQSDPPMLR